MKAKQNSWIGMTAFLCLVVLVGAWFLLSKPVLDEANETEELALEQDQKNDRERAAIAVLKQQWENIEEYRATLAGLETQIPLNLEHAQFQREVADLADEHDVAIVALDFQTSAEVPLGAVTDAVNEALDDGSGESEPAVANVQGFFSTQVTIDVQGEYADVLEVIEGLQASEDRLFLVLGVAGTAMSDTDEGSGLPAREAGDLQAVITGQVYTLLDRYNTAGYGEVGEPDTTLPKPSGNTNPMSDKN